jgi:hypothetical protein
MKSTRSQDLFRWIVSFFLALVAILVVVPLLLDGMGLRSNLEEFVAPTKVARAIRAARVPVEVTREALAVAPQPQSAIAAPLLAPQSLNGVPVERIALISDAAREHIRDIYALGQSLGRNPRAVSKVGDSTMVYPPFLATFDRRTYRLGSYAYLQETIDYHSGSFGRTSAAVRIGMHTWSQFDPEWIIPELCSANEGPLACELRLHNPSIAIIRLGANDTEFPGMFERHLGNIVKYCLARGIIPVLGTKPDRYEGPSNLINNLIRKTASAYSVPLWDFDLIAETIPGRGLEADGLHMQGGNTRDFTLNAALRAGDALEDLTALMVLHEIRQELGATPP